MNAPSDDPRRQLTWRRLRSRQALIALLASAIGALGTALGTVLIGWLATEPSPRLVGLLAVCVIGAALIDTVGRVIWAGQVDRAEGELRGDLLSAALAQPVSVLSEQAVGEVLDRVDDDTHEVGTLTRELFWRFARTMFTLPPLYVVVSVSWWPGWVLFPLIGLAVFASIRGLLVRIADLKVHEEAAWTDNAAALEEAITARDDLRTSLGQSHVVRRLAELSAVVHRRLQRVVRLEGRMALRSGMLLHAMLAATALTGVLMVQRDALSVSELVTVFLATSLFVGQVAEAAHQLPDLQAGLGAVIRLRQMLDTEPEPVGGRDLPAEPLSVRFVNLHFAHTEGGFALHEVNLEVPAGQTCALVGRTGSGKSTLASLLSRAVEPEPGSVLVGGIDVLDCDLQQLRTRVGVVTQRTEILAGTLAENIALFGEVARTDIGAAVSDLGLADWVASLPDGLDTLLGPGGITLSAGEEQLVAFARLLVRDVQVVVLDEATARMDPVTEARVVAAADRLLSTRTGLIVTHRLSTTERADLVAVLDHGRVVQQGSRAALAGAPGEFRDLLAAAGERPPEDPQPAAPTTENPATPGTASRRRSHPPAQPEPGDGRSLAGGIWHALWIHPRWGMWTVLLFGVVSVTGALGPVTGLIWGHLVEDLRSDRGTGWLTVALVVSLLISPALLAECIKLYPRWWIAVMLRVRLAVLLGQTRQHRLRRTPPGEVAARALDSDRFVRYADNWVDVLLGLTVVMVTAALTGTALAGMVLFAVMGVSAAASLLGRPFAGRAATAASAARARFGRSLVSALESTRTVKLAGATDDVHRHLLRVDAGRVGAAVTEHRVAAILPGIPNTMIQAGIVATWAIHTAGGWPLATALLVSGAVSGFGWFGQVAGKVITDAPGCRSWQLATARLAGGVDLVRVPAGVDLVAGTAPAPADAERTELQTLSLRSVDVIHDDGTLGAEQIDLEVRRGELVLLLGQVGSGKSSLLSAIAGLVEHTGELRWNDVAVDDPQTFLRPGQVSLVRQVPRVLSGTFVDNITLDHQRPVDTAVADARLGEDVAEAGGVEAVVGHRGVRLSGGQVQRLALARALACEAELLLADDVSSALDARTEVELWQALRARGTTVLGATSKRAALAQADRVVVLADGRIVAVGPWSELAAHWSHLSA